MIRVEVSNHTVRYDQKFHFPCKMNANSNTGKLSPESAMADIHRISAGSWVPEAELVLDAL